MVGSRCSMVCTEAVTKPSNSALDVPVQLAVLDRDGRLRRQGRRERHAVVVERDHLRGGDLGRVEPHVGIALAVDQLQHADDLVAV